MRYFISFDLNEKFPGPLQSQSHCDPTLLASSPLLFQRKTIQTSSVRHRNLQSPDERFQRAPGDNNIKKYM